jgi:hypothetical protein
VLYVKALERILWLAYGNHTQTSEYRELAEILIQRLRNDDLVEKQELMREIGLDPSVESDDQKFKRVMRPLKGQKKSNPLDIQFVVQRRMDDGSYYALSRDAFDSSSRTVVQNIRRFIDSSPRQVIADLESEIQELREENAELRRKLEGA